MSQSALSMILIRHLPTRDDRAERISDPTADLEPLEEVAGFEGGALAWARRVTGAKTVYHAPNLRCRLTAELCGGGQLRLIEDSRLSNILVPRWAGRLESELEGEEDWRLFLNEPLEFFPAGGESIVEVVKRIDSFIDDLDRGPTPIIVSHTTPLQVLWLRALGLPLENLWLTEFKFHALTMVVGGCLEVQNLPWRAEVGSLELLGQ